MKNENKNLTIKYNEKIKKAVKKLNHTGKKFLAVVDNKNRYMGSLTDADIRRNILKNLRANTIISKVFNMPTVEKPIIIRSKNVVVSRQRNWSYWGRYVSCFC